MKKIVILGGGFAGVQAAIELQKSKQFEVTLVSDRDYLFVYPLSIWIPVHLMEFEDVKVPLKKIIKKYPFDLIIDTVKGIKAADNHVICESQVLSYDYLVVAIGDDKLQHKGINHTLTICGKPERTLELRDKLDALIEKGTGKIAIGFGSNPKDKSAVRGEPAFEFIFNIHHFLKKKGVRDNFTLTFFAPMKEPATSMGKGAVKLTNKMFKQQDIEKRVGKEIVEFVSDGVIFEDKSKLESDLIMFISAGTGSAVLAKTDLPLSDSGFIKINDYNQVPAFPNVFAIGDTTAYEGPEWRTKQGHIAELMGRNAAQNIIRMENKRTHFKVYRKHLSILYVLDTGNGAAFVFRNRQNAIVIPLPVVGHWMKKAWGVYTKFSKTGKIKIPFQ